MSLLEDVRSKLSSAGVLSGGYLCFIGYVPDDQDKIIGLIFSGGEPQDTLEGENVIQHFQVKVRAGRLDFAACETKWQAAFNALQDATITDVYLIQAMATGPLTWYEEKQRPCMSLNMRVIRDKP